MGDRDGTEGDPLVRSGSPNTPKTPPAPSADDDLAGGVTVAVVAAIGVGALAAWAQRSRTRNRAPPLVSQTTGDAEAKFKDDRRTMSAPPTGSQMNPRSSIPDRTDGEPEQQPGFGKRAADAAGNAAGNAAAAARKALISARDAVAATASRLRQSKAKAGAKRESGDEDDSEDSSGEGQAAGEAHPARRSRPRARYDPTQEPSGRFSQAIGAAAGILMDPGEEERKKQFDEAVKNYVNRHKAGSEAAVEYFMYNPGEISRYRDSSTKFYAVLTGYVILLCILWGTVGATTQFSSAGFWGAVVGSVVLTAGMVVVRNATKSYSANIFRNMTNGEIAGFWFVVFVLVLATSLFSANETASESTTKPGATVAKTSWGFFGGTLVAYALTTAVGILLMKSFEKFEHMTDMFASKKWMVAAWLIVGLLSTLHMLWVHDTIEKRLEGDDVSAPNASGNTILGAVFGAIHAAIFLGFVLILWRRKPLEKRVNCTVINKPTNQSLVTSGTGADRERVMQEVKKRAAAVKKRAAAQ